MQLTRSRWFSWSSLAYSRSPILARVEVVSLLPSTCLDLELAWDFVEVLFTKCREQSLGEGGR